MKNKIVPRARKFVAVLLGLLFICGTLLTVNAESDESVEIKSASYSGGTLSVTIDSESNLGKVPFIITAFNESGKLTGVRNRFAEIPAGGSKFSITDCPEGETFKVFILSKTFTPVCAAKTITTKDSESSLPAIIASNCTTTTGEKSVTMEISIANNPGVLGMTLGIEFDDSAMKLTSASNGSAFSGVLNLTRPKTMKTGCNFIWDGVEIESESVKDGTILTLTFEISDSAEAGTYPVTLICGGKNAVDNNLNPINFRLSGGTITVSH